MSGKVDDTPFSAPNLPEKKTGFTAEQTAFIEQVIDTANEKTMKRLAQDARAAREMAQDSFDTRIKVFAAVALTVVTLMGIAGELTSMLIGDAFVLTHFLTSKWVQVVVSVIGGLGALISTRALKS